MEAIQPEGTRSRAAALRKETDEGTGVTEKKYDMISLYKLLTRNNRLPPVPNNWQGRTSRAGPRLKDIFKRAETNVPYKFLKQSSNVSLNYEESVAADRGH